MQGKKWVHLVAVLMTLIAVGCGKGDDKKAEEKKDDGGKPVAKKDAVEHDHGSGPHGGAVAEWGDGNYHVEFTVDHGKKQATIYVLGSDGKSAAPIKAAKLLLSINDPACQVDLSAQPEDGEAAGSSSRFVGQHENLGIVREFEGTISGAVDGKPFAGDFEEKP